MRKTSESVDDYPGKWIRRRHLDGSLNRVPETFYARVWDVLSHCEGLSIYQTCLSAKPTVYDMTANEKGFAVLVESILEGIPMPEKRQLIVEVLMVLSFMFEKNQGLQISHNVDLVEIVETANDIYTTLQPDSEEQSKRESYKASFYDLPPNCQSNSTAHYISEAIFRVFSKSMPTLDKKDLCEVQ